MNVGNPQEAFSLSAIPNDGVGLARTEFIIANQIQVHPLALIHYDNLADAEQKAKVAAITAMYDDKPQYFVDKLAQGVGRIAAAFYPKPVIVRMSDFKSNEYRNLAGVPNLNQMKKTRCWAGGGLHVITIQVIEKVLL